MKKCLTAFFIFFTMLLFSCDGETEQRERESENLRIQGEETGGMGTGPGPGVEVPLDTARNIQPDTIIIE
jgi:hypothetical protein